MTISRSPSHRPRLAAQTLAALVAHFSCFAMYAASATAAPVPDAAAPHPYRVGYLVDASSTEQQTIKPSLDGLNLYLAQLNQAGGVKGRPVELVVRDTRSDLQQLLDAVADLAHRGVSGIAGMGISSTHGPVYAAAQRVGLPVLAAFPANTSVVLSPAKPNAFNVTAAVGGYLAEG